MNTQKKLSWAAWIPAALVVVALVVGFAPWSADSISTSSSPEAGVDTTEGPMLVGRAGADDDAPIQLGDSSVDDARGVSDDDVFMDDADDADDAHIVNGLPLTASHPLVAPVIKVQERYTRELMERPLVVGTAVGMNEFGEIAVVVLLSEPTTDLPVTLDGVPVMGFVSGEMFASGKPAGKPGKGGGDSEPAIDRTARFARPVPIGVSTGHPLITAGTIGCRVKKGSSRFALSNNHVFARLRKAGLGIGDGVIQPGTYDGGDSHVSSDGTTLVDEIGTLYDFVVIDFASGAKNKVDAAIATTTTALLSNGTPSDGYGVPESTTAAAAINARVRKYGRTTGQTNAKVYAVNATVNVGYGSKGVARFVQQIIITPGNFSAGGDSGSLIVGQKGSTAGQPVGLLFAGSTFSTIANPIDLVLDAFGVTVDGK